MILFMLCLLDDLVRIGSCDIWTGVHQPGDAVAAHLFKDACPCRILEHWPDGSGSIVLRCSLKGVSTLKNYCWSS